jgi:hypothetical protein
LRKLYTEEPAGGSVEGRGGRWSLSRHPELGAPRPA